jgi:transposase-like protein
MKKEDLLSEEFLKQFKTGEELYSFLGQLQKRGVEAILEGELDNHLGYWIFRTILTPQISE